jgi:DNA invertase Pin-like site-specific DNA recombinase
LKLTDRGKSGFRRKNWETYALAQFVAEIEAGNVLPGDFLLVENLDRLSREEAGEAVELFLRIVNAGVIIVQLLPQVFEYKRPVNAMTLMIAVVELSRGHSESATKSARSQANWDKALRLARGEKRPMTGRLPAWVTWDEDGGLTLVVERAKVVRRIFELAAAGLGMTSIVKTLNAEGVKAFGARVVDEPDEDDDDDKVHHRKVDGETFGSGEWRTSYVRSILSDRRVLGELQPCDRNGKPKGEPLTGYYPPVVEPEVFHAARAAVLGRKNNGTANRQGAIGKGVPNLFSGLLKNARDHGSYYVALRVDQGVRSHMLRSQGGTEGKGAHHTFPYAVFERAILSQLRELDPAAVVGDQGGADEVVVLKGERDHVRERRAKLAALLRGDDDVAELVEELRRLKNREAELSAQLDAAEQRAAKPLAETLGDAKRLIDLLDSTPPEEQEELRLRVRAALRRLLSTVWVLVAPSGAGRRLAAVQLVFEGGGTREYFIDVQGPRANQNGRRPGWWLVMSSRVPHKIRREHGWAVGLVPWNLADTEGVAAAENWLKTVSLDLDTATYPDSNHPRHPLP